MKINNINQNLIYMIFIISIILLLYTGCTNTKFESQFQSQNIDYKNINKSYMMGRAYDYNIKLIEYNDLIDFNEINNIFTKGTSEIEKKIFFNNKKVIFKNNIIIKNETIYVELNDLSLNFNLNFDSKCKVYDKNNIGISKEDSFYYINEDQISNKEKNMLINNGMSLISFILSKDEFSFEFALNSSKVLKKGLEESRIKTIPSISILVKKSNKALIYLPLIDTLDLFGYNVNEDTKLNNIEIQDTKNRKTMSWQDIYIYILELLELNISFSLYDFTNDGIPELLLETSDIMNSLFDESNFGNIYTPAYYPYFDIKSYVCYWFNPETKLFERQFVRCVGYEPQNNLALIKFPDSTISSEFYKWNNKEQCFVNISDEIMNNYNFVELMNNSREFKAYTLEELKNEKKNLKDLVYFYSKYFINEN